MAILKNFELTITSGGRTLQEYDVGPDEENSPDDLATLKPPSIVKYVEAIPGANFQINYATKRRIPFGRADHLTFQTYLDGQEVWSPVMLPEHNQSGGGFHHVQEGMESERGAPEELRPYYWTEILTTDERPDATVAEIKERYGQMGTIRVEVKRGINASDTTQSDEEEEEEEEEEDTQEDLLGEQPIPEAALKGQAVELGIGLQDPKPWGQMSDVCGGVYIDENPRATFVFRYRTKNALQILGIIPRSPTLVPLEERDPKTLSRGELLSLVLSQQAPREVERTEIKKEKDETNLLSLPIRRKRDAPGSGSGGDHEEDGDLMVVDAPVKKARHAEIIDLTSSDDGGCAEEIEQDGE